MTKTGHQFFVDDEGHLCELPGYPGFDQLRCGVCDEPFRGVMELFGWVRNERRYVWQMTHARCAWTPEAFDRKTHRGKRRPMRLLPRRRPRSNAPRQVS